VARFSAFSWLRFWRARAFHGCQPLALLLAVVPLAGGSHENMITEADLTWVRYKYFSKPQAEGHKRNVAVAMARGRVAVSWSEYDMYGPSRVEEQVRPIIDGKSHGKQPFSLLCVRWVHLQCVWHTDPPLSLACSHGSGFRLAVQRNRKQVL
jgi:hypothetical protein